MTLEAKHKNRELAPLILWGENINKTQKPSAFCVFLLEWRPQTSLSLVPFSLVGVLTNETNT
jgi:hypothetical protein